MKKIYLYSDENLERNGHQKYQTSTLKGCVLSFVNHLTPLVTSGLYAMHPYNTMVLNILHDLFVRFTGELSGLKIW